MNFSKRFLGDKDSDERPKQAGAGAANAASSAVASTSTAPWRSRPVFISSTFRDMHAERDHLVKAVFHERRVS